jgi:hypothetical protein
MHIFTFMSVATNIRGYTSDKAGNSLPVEFAPWHTTGGTETMVTSPTDPIALAIQQDGYFLVSGNVSREGRLAKRRPSGESHYVMSTLAASRSRE